MRARVSLSRCLVNAVPRYEERAGNLDRYERTSRSPKPARRPSPRRLIAFAVDELERECSGVRLSEKVRI